MARPYQAHLDRLTALCAGLPNTPMTAQARINALALLYLRWEALQIDRDLPEHPFVLVERLVAETVASLEAWGEVLWAEAPERGFEDARNPEMETMHEDLFQRLWTMFDIEQYKADRIGRYVHRIDLNDIAPLIAGKDCIDFGCGHGNFAHALVTRGARRVLGVDYGEASLRHAEKMRALLGVPDDVIGFRQATVYETGEPSESYDFAIQNGVFHHLDDEDRAYREVHRVLKPGGWFWVYSSGIGAIVQDIWEAARGCLRNVPPTYIIAQLAHLNLATGKRYHLGDGLNAIYRRTSWEELTGRLQGLGFGDFRRLTGGFPTDFDHDVIAADKWGTEKFGSGDLRLVCRKLP
jgi:2-polyprenyl-3-methyl-5-hydroxy-6-metoxy-1,4-benzoquinol methylase